MSISEAKTKFSGLISDVLSKQEEVTITKHGRDVAKIIPIGALKSQADRHALIKDIEALSQEIGKSQIGLREIREMRTQGQR